MNKKISRIIAFVAITGWVMFAGINAYADDSALVVQPDFPKIISQPEDQMVYLGSNATFTVKAVNTDGYQWLRNGNPINGQTNASLTITNAGINDVGYYSCHLFKDIEVVPTRAANLMIYTSSIDPQTGIDPIVVFGLPLAGGGSQPPCPGSYAGYVNYTKTISKGWGWAPDSHNTTVFTASDTNRTDTKIEYVGAYGDVGCNSTTTTVPNSPISPVYRFTIFFTSNVPTNAYAITLDGFKP
jgi:hypothetical protein